MCGVRSEWETLEANAAGVHEHQTPGEGGGLAGGKIDRCTARSLEFGTGLEWNGIPEQYHDEQPRT